MSLSMKKNRVKKLALPKEKKNRHMWNLPTFDLCGQIDDVHMPMSNYHTWSEGRPVPCSGHVLYEYK